MFYLSSPVKTPKFSVLWAFFVVTNLYIYFYKNSLDLLFVGLIAMQILPLYIMFYFFIKYAQIAIRIKTLPINIEFKKINLASSFNAPNLEPLTESNNILIFEAHLHNDYYKDDYQYKDKLNEKIRCHVNIVWQHVLVYLKKYDSYLKKILAYCFIFGLIILLFSVIPYSQMDWNGYADIHKKTYKFFTFLSLSFWMYVTIILLSNEAIIQKKQVNKHHSEIYTIYNNSNLNTQEKAEELTARWKIQELTQRIEVVDKYIVYYINISTTILYIGFLTILGIMF
jgi:hypothetical protein